MKGVRSVIQVHRDHIYLDWLYVKPEYRGRGLASRRLRQVCKLADRLGLPVGLLAMPCESGMTLPRLVKLYASAGFELDVPESQRDLSTMHCVGMIRMPISRARRS